MHPNPKITKGLSRARLCLVGAVVAFAACSDGEGLVREYSLRVLAESLPYHYGDIGFIGDVDDDGEADIFLENLGPATPLELVYGWVVDVTDEARRQLRATAGNASSGADRIAFLGDLDGDGVDSFAVASFGVEDLDILLRQFGESTEPSPPHESSAVRVFSSLEGEPDFTVEGEHGSRLGSAMIAYGHIDGDEIADILIGAPGVEPSGVILVVAGSNGSRIATIEPTDAPSGALFGASIERLADQDGDGLPELLVGAPGMSAVYCVDSAGRRPLRLVRSDEADFGEQLLPLDTGLSPSSVESAGFVASVAGGALRCHVLGGEWKLEPLVGAGIRFSSFVELRDAASAGGPLVLALQMSAGFSREVMVWSSSGSQLGPFVFPDGLGMQLLTLDADRDGVDDLWVDADHRVTILCGAKLRQDLGLR